MCISSAVGRGDDVDALGKRREFKLKQSYPFPGGRVGAARSSGGWLRELGPLTLVWKALTRQWMDHAAQALSSLLKEVETQW